MAKKRRKLKYEEPVTKLELNTRLDGAARRRLRRRIARSARIPSELESQARIEQAVGFIAESRLVSIHEARDVLSQHAAEGGLTMGEAAEQVLRREG